MGVRAAQDPTVQQAGHLDICPKFGPASHLVQAVVTDGPGAHHLKFAWTFALLIDNDSHKASLLKGIFHIALSTVGWRLNPLPVIYVPQSYVSSS